MIAIALTPFGFAVLLRIFGARLAARLHPRLAVPVLTALGLTASLCSGLVLSVAAILFLAQLPGIARIGGWSIPTLRSGSAWPWAVGLLASVLVVGLLGLACVRAARSIRTLVASERAAQRFESADGELVILHDEVPTAYSVAGIRGRIVVSTSMLAALSPAQRRVLLAHEASHLRHRHQLYLHLISLAGAANPLVRPTAALVASAVERWADEDAADEVGDRRLAAHGLGRAALATADHRRVSGALAVADHDVTERVRALLRPAPAGGSMPVVLAVAAGVVCWAAAATIVFWGNALIQLAESAYQR